MPKTTEAQRRAHKKYIAKFSRVEIRMKTDEFERMQAHATDRAESINGFINRAIKETMERDKGKSAHWEKSDIP